MVLMLGDLRSDFRKLPDLLAQYIGTVGQVRRQLGRTVRAGARMVWHDAVDLFGRQQWTMMAIMTRLPTTRTTARSGRRTWRSRRRVGGGRLGRVAGVLIEASLQFDDLLLEHDDLLLEREELLDERKRSKQKRAHRRWCGRPLGRSNPFWRCRVIVHDGKDATKWPLCQVVAR
jgi:hypothetical protein